MTEGTAPASLSGAEKAPLRPAPKAFGERVFGSVNWLGMRTLYMKEVRRFLKVAFQTIFAPVISTLLFLVVFTQAFGADRPAIGGVPFIEFLAPGLIMMSVLTNAFTNSSSSLIISKVQGSIVDVLMPPLSPSELAVAFVAGAATRGLLVGFVTAITSAGFMMANGAPMQISALWAVLYFSVAAALIFAMLGVLGGLWALVLRSRFDVIPVLLITVREIVISVWRSRLGRQGVSVPARKMAKWKTFIQQLAIGFAILPLLDGRADVVADITLWLAVVLTLWSAARYLADGTSALRQGTT